MKRFLKTIEDLRYAQRVQIHHPDWVNDVDAIYTRDNNREPHHLWGWRPHSVAMIKAYLDMGWDVEIVQGLGA